jgi:hypothetical protein
METPRVEGGNPPLAIEWVPQDVDLSVQSMMVYNPKGMASRMLAIPQELLPPMSGNAEWPAHTTANQFFKILQELVGKLINQRLSGVEGQVNEMLELMQAREDVLRKAQSEMQGQVMFLAHQVREMAEVDELSQMDWQPTSTIIIPDFEKIIEEKVNQRLYHRRTSRGVPPPIPAGRKKKERRSLLEPPVRSHRRSSRSPSPYVPRSPSEGDSHPSSLADSDLQVFGTGEPTPTPAMQASGSGRGPFGGEWVETFTRGSERMAATQPPPSPPQRSNPPPQQERSVPPPSGPPAPPAGGVAGGAPDPGDSSGDDGEDGEPNPRRHPNRWKSWQKKKIKKELEMAGFVDAVRAVVGKDKKKDDEPTSTGKSPDPQSFDGNPEELERFLRQLSNKFALERRHYKQDIDKIRYASLLLKGNAAKWYEAYHLHIDSSAADYIRGRHEPLDASFATWDRFVASLRSSFGSRLTREKAVREFEKLEHSKGIDAFLDELTRLIWQTGYSDDVVKDKISRSLNKELSKDWSKVLDKPDSLAGWLVRLREMGHNNERWEEQYGNSKSLSKSAKASGGKKGEGSKGNGGNQKGSGDSSKGKKRDGGWKDKSVELKGIPKKLLDERGDANKCLKCGKDNHKWFECWSKEPVTTKVAAGAKRKAQKEPKEEKAEDKPSKKSKTASAKKEEKAVTAAISHNIIEVSEDEDMDKAWAE